MNQAQKVNENIKTQKRMNMVKDYMIAALESFGFGVGKQGDINEKTAEEIAENMTRENNPNFSTMEKEVTRVKIASGSDRSFVKKENPNTKEALTKVANEEAEINKIQNRIKELEK